MVSDLDRHDPPLSVDLKAERLGSSFLPNASQGCAGSNPAFGTNHTFPAPIKAFTRFYTIIFNTCYHVVWTRMAKAQYGIPKLIELASAALGKPP